MRSLNLALILSLLILASCAKPKATPNPTSDLVPQFNISAAGTRVTCSASFYRTGAPGQPVILEDDVLATCNGVAMASDGAGNYAASLALDPSVPYTISVFRPLDGSTTLSTSRTF